MNYRYFRYVLRKSYNIVNCEPEPEHPVKCKLLIAAELVSIRIAAGIKFSTVGWLRSLQLGAAITAYPALHINFRNFTDEKF
ncbi:hypothetical protein [Nostoc sp. ChiQUE01b]|uniref:hypothetical protein n=1 Tax=Nostoc sp. ChiQUE01b TaxID=3075376 RepID=UPI002AD31562|nr:hypothetical protein [Nostoc sp. ChiQUE01b]MDZ8259602.1 hypothetical protein [Nostoc sp. ChiQUE01b]